MAKARAKGRPVRGGVNSPLARANRAAEAYLAQDPAATDRKSMGHFARVEGCNVGFVSLRVTVLRREREAAGQQVYRLFSSDHKPLAQTRAA